MLDPFNTNSTTPASNLFFAMRTRIDSGFVKWVKAFKIKDFLRDKVGVNLLFITETEIAWITITLTYTPYLYRMSSNGTILQVIPQNSKTPSQFFNVEKKQIVNIKFNEVICKC